LAKRDDEISTLKHQLETAEDTIATRNQQIEHLTKIRTNLEAQTHDTPIPQELTQSQVLREVGIEEQNALAAAAKKTIETLQEMVDNKNAVVDRKDQQID
jgi:predicted HAD superfamily Cof-like phosphohydrolase